MGLSKRWASGSYWKQQHTIKTPMVVAVAVEANSVERFGAERAHTRGTNLFLGKQYQPHISKTKKANCSKENNFFLYWSGARTSIWLVMRNTFSVEGVFLAESQYAWWCGHVPCLGAIDASASTYRYCLYLWTKYYGKIPCLLDSMDNKICWEKKKEIFFFFCFQPDPLEHWVHQCHAPNYPALSMCMPLTVRVW